ncbi:hypothetical protein D5282_05295 [bacterium 1xD8-48]|nr:hypothetical protein [Lachnospiraceae bacterium]NBJ96744.1 hypothetical protein [bacterium 1xD8-48]
MMKEMAGKVKVFGESKEFHRVWKLVENIVFPLVLLLFPLLKVQEGIDLTDTGYSLGNYRFFGESGGIWEVLTFLSNVTGFLFTKLPMGKTMLGMKIYSSLIISLMGLLGYRFFKTKMPAALAFAGEVAAIGLCWCPPVILYNYVTYFLFLLGSILLFRGLAGGRRICLFLAGAALGANVMARFPGNVLEAGLILAAWYYGLLKRKTVKALAKETGICLLGYLSFFLALLLAATLLYGSGTLGNMITGVLGMAGSASDYTPGEMLLAIVDAYFHGFQWMLYMLLCILPGIPFLIIGEGRFLRLRKIVYCLCIPVLFLVLYKWGMFNFKYFQKEAALQWGAVFLLVCLGVTVWMLFTRMLDDEWRLIGCIALLIILITPLGSNNHIWPVLNNLFFIAPVAFWMIYRFARWGRTWLDTTRKVPLFPAKAMFSGMMIAFFVQALGVGCQYVFLDGETGEPRVYKVAANPVLHGMHTSEMNGETLEEISRFMTEHRAEYESKKLILYGNIPGLSYYLDKGPAIYTAWADLNTNSLERLEEELQELAGLYKENHKDRPLVILSPPLAAYLSGEEKTIAWWGVDVESCKKDEKLKAIEDYMEAGAYEQVFGNEAFVVYE